MGLKYFLLLLPLNACCAWTFSKFRSVESSKSIGTTRFYGYLPPERDPEYRSVIKPSLLRPLETPNSSNSTSLNSLDNTSLLPIPKDGDIVRYKGKWENEYSYGKIRSLYYSNVKEGWCAEIIPLSEGKSESVYFIDRKEKAIDELISNTQPVLSYFVRSENGYKISFKKNSTVASLKSMAYRPLSKDYTLPTKSINIEKLSQGLQEYSDLKSRLLKSTLTLGTAGFALSTAALGFDVSLPYGLGVLCGVIYIFQLGKKTDSIGQGYAAKSVSIDRVEGIENDDSAARVVPISLGLPQSATRIDEIIAKSRFLSPVFLVALLAGYKFYAQNSDVQLFRALSPAEFLGAMAGFLTYFASIIFVEVGKELRTEDWLSFLPGSFAEAFRRGKNAAAVASANEALQQPELTKVLFVTGPRAAGRSAVARYLSSTNNVAKGKTLKNVKFLTTQLGLQEAEPDRFKFVSEISLSDLRREGTLVFEGIENGMFGSSFSFALSLDDLLEPAKEGKIAVVDGPPELLDALAKYSKLRLLNVWISLQTKEQFIAKATEMVQRQLTSSQTLTSKNENLAKRSAEEVSILVNEAAKDINTYMQKAPLFEYTMLNSGTSEETAEELEMMLSTVL